MSSRLGTGSRARSSLRITAAPTAARSSQSGLGALVVTIRRRGYGAAVCGGFAAARGRYLVMGDADGSYDFVEAVPMVEALMNGADLCMGSRFSGAIQPGAMPWKNRYVGNPVLTGILNLLFPARASTTRIAACAR